MPTATYREFRVVLQHAGFRLVRSKKLETWGKSLPKYLGTIGRDLQDPAGGPSERALAGGGRGPGVSERGGDTGPHASHGRVVVRYAESNPLTAFWKWVKLRPLGVHWE